MDNYHKTGTESNTAKELSSLTTMIKVQKQEVVASSNEPPEEFGSSGDSVKEELIQITQEAEEKANRDVTDGIISKQQGLKEEHTLPISSSNIDECSISIDESSLLKFRNNFFEVIEELRIQRTLDLENEGRIETLMTEKHELERKKEEEISKYNALVEQHAQREIDTKKQQEDRLLQFGEEKAKQALVAECTEKEIKILKDEVRALHLVKYNLEKKIKEQERLIQLQNTARDSHESQMTGLEQRCRKAFDQCTVLADLVDKTESNISAASRLHKKLMYTNEHQKCLLESYKRELESQKFELVSLKATVAQGEDSVKANEDEKLNRVDTLEKELRMQNEVCRQLQSQLDDSRKQNEHLAESLKQAHVLLERHVQSINKHSELEAVAHLELDEIKTECQTLRDSLKDEVKKKHGFKDELVKRKAEWDEEKQSLENRVEDLQKEYDLLSHAHNSLEQLNSSWSERNMEQRNNMETLNREMDELKKQLVQAEEEAQSHSTENEELRKNHVNETSIVQEQLLQTKEDCKKHMEREELLQKQCTELNQKVEDLMKKITENVEEQAKDTVVTDAAIQTDEILKIENAEEQAKDTSVTDAAVQTDGVLKSQTGLKEPQEDDLNTEKDTKENTIEVSKPTTPARYDCHSAKEQRLLNSKEELTSQPEEAQQEVNVLQQKGNADEGGVLLVENERRRHMDSQAGSTNEKQDRFKDCTFQSHERAPLENLEKTSDHNSVLNSTTVTTKIKEYSPSGGAVREDLSYSSQAGNSEKESTEVFAPSKINLAVTISGGEGKINVGNESKSSAANTRNVDGEETESNGSSIALVDNNSNLKSFKKKVRFNLEANDSLPLKSIIANDKTPAAPDNPAATERGELQMMFSDEEDEGDECSNLDKDVNQRITRIQSLLKNDRLRTNRKRKHPVI